MEGVKEPALLVEEKVTVPVGDEPVTVAVHVVEKPSIILDGEQDTDVALAAETTDRTKVPTLPRLLESPP